MEKPNDRTSGIPSYIFLHIFSTSSRPVLQFSNTPSLLFAFLLAEPFVSDHALRAGGPEDVDFCFELNKIFETKIDFNFIITLPVTRWKFGERI